MINSKDMMDKVRYKTDNISIIEPLWDQLIEQSNDFQWLLNLRQCSQKKIFERGLPTTKLERFKYFNFLPILKKKQMSLSKKCLGDSHFLDLMKPISDHLDQKWVQDMFKREPVSDHKYGDMMLWDINTMLTQHGFLLDIPRDTSIETPFQVHLNHSADQVFMQRNVIRLQENATVIIVEYQNGKQNYWSNSVTQIELHSGASLMHYIVKDQGIESLNTDNYHITLAERAEYRSFCFHQGQGMARHQVHVDLCAPQAKVYLNGIHLLKDKQNVDTTITVEHHAPDCVSQQNYRHVLFDQSVSTYQGKVHVHQEAQKTDGYQLSNALLLSPQATMNTKPELEIYADDVKCSHGATTGKLDEEALFYLKSRGIPHKEASNLLVEAFLNDIIHDIDCIAVQEDMKQRILEAL